MSRNDSGGADVLPAFRWAAAGAAVALLFAPASGEDTGTIWEKAREDAATEAAAGRDLNRQRTICLGDRKGARHIAGPAAGESA
jgi:hypothetical protein